MQLRASLTDPKRYRIDGAFLTAWLASPRATSFCVGAALMVVGGALGASVLVAALACALVALTWRVERRAGLALGALALVVLGALAALHRMPFDWTLAARALTLVGAMLVPEPGESKRSSYGGPRARGASRREPDSGGSPFRLPPSASGAARWMVQRTGARGDQVARATLERFLSDLRESLAVDHVTLWRIGAEGTGSLTLRASSAAVEGRATQPADEQMKIVRWAAQERLPVSSPEDEPDLIVAAPVERAGLPYGVLAAGLSGKTRHAKGELKKWIARYAQQAGTLVELVEQGRRAGRYARHVEDLLNSAGRLQKHTEFSALAEAICEAALHVTGASRALLATWDASGEQGQVDCVSSKHPIERGFLVTPDSLVAMSMRVNQRYVFEDRRDLGAATTIVGRGEPFRNIGSLAVMPLVHDVDAVGAIVVEGEDADQITDVEADALALLASLASVAMDTCRQFEQITRRAFIDALTGIANRRKFDERLNQMLAECDRFGHSVCLIMVDIDRFKGVNDHFGHSAGDQVLRQVAMTLGQGIREIDLCARYGGEEMAVLLPQTSAAVGVEVAERLRHAIESLNIIHGGQRIPVTASFGVASYPDIARTRATLVDAADRALYEAKCAGRNCVKAYALTASRSG